MVRPVFTRGASYPWAKIRVTVEGPPGKRRRSFSGIVNEWLVYLEFVSPELPEVAEAGLSGIKAVDRQLDSCLVHANSDATRIFENTISAFESKRPCVISSSKYLGSIPVWPGLHI